MTMGKVAVTDLVEAWRTDGFAVACGYVDDELLARLAAGADALIARFASGHRSPDFWCYEQPGRELPVLYRIHNLEAQGSEEIVDLFSGNLLRMLAARFLGAAARPTVCAMVVKTRGVAGVPWHRDRADVSAGVALNLSVYLDQSDAGNGCFEAVVGSHLLDDAAEVEAVRASGPRVHVPAGPGDVLIHDVRLVHGSGDNNGVVERRSIITEFAASPGAQR